MFRRSRPFHRQQDRTAPLPSDADALHEPQDRQNDSTPDPDALIGRHQTDQEGRDAHEQQRRDQRRFAADSVPVVAEDRRSHRPRDEADRVDRERFQGSDQRIRPREIEVRKDETGDGAVQKEVVPLDRGSHRARNHSASQLDPVRLLR